MCSALKKRVGRTVVAPTIANEPVVHLRAEWSPPWLIRPITDQCHAVVLDPAAPAGIVHDASSVKLKRRASRGYRDGDRPDGGDGVHESVVVVHRKSHKPIVCGVRLDFLVLALASLPSVARRVLVVALQRNPRLRCVVVRELLGGPFASSLAATLARVWRALRGWDWNGCLSAGSGMGEGLSRVGVCLCLRTETICWTDSLGAFSLSFSATIDSNDSMAENAQHEPQSP